MKKIFFFLFFSFLFFNTYSIENTECQEKQKENWADEVLLNAADKVFINAGERLRHFAVPAISELMLRVLSRHKKVDATDKIFFNVVRASNACHLLSALILPKKIRERTTIFFEDVSIFMSGATFFLIMTNS